MKALVFLLLPLFALATKKTIPKDSNGGIYFKNSFLVPGDTALIQAGTYNYISLDGLVGAPGKPITVINSGGQVIAGQSNYCYRVVNSRYFKITGTGDTAVTYGFKAWWPGGRAGSGMNIKENCSDYEIEFYEAWHVENGFLCKIDPYDCLPESWAPNFLIQNVLIHDNYVHDTGGEGYYLINTAETVQVKDCTGNFITIETVMGKNWKVYRNISDSTGWDGIQLAATTNAEIYDNYVTNYGMQNKGSQQAGIIFGAKSTGSVHDNYINGGTGEGLQVFGYGTINIYNNIISNAGHDGTASGQNALAIDDRPNPGNKYIGQLVNVINNTIVKAGRNAILYNNSTRTQLPGRVYNNLLVAPGNPSPWDDPFINLGVASDTSNNLRYRNISDVGFFDTTIEDYHLNVGTVGKNTAAYGVLKDFDGVDRVAYDIGAYEQLSNIILPPPPPPVTKPAYYFSNSGDDSRTPTEARDSLSPWATIDKLNSIFPILVPGDQILFKSGDTFTGTIKPTRNGSVTDPIVFSSYDSGVQPKLTEMQPLTGWVLTQLGVYESKPINAGKTVNAVTLDGNIQQVGRYPNTGFMTFESHSSISITDNQLTSNWVGAELVVKPKRWILDRRPISAQYLGTIYFTGALTYTPYDNYGYFIQNDIRTLDTLGEWYYNPVKKTVSMFFGANDPNYYDVQASVKDSIVNINRISNLVFDGLNFEGANQYAFNLDYGQNITIKNCSITNTGITAIRASSTSQLYVKNNYINNSLNNGVDMAYNCSRSEVSNNLITNTGWIAGMGLSGNANYQAVNMYGNHNKAEFNRIINTGAIGIKFYYGDSNLVNGNFIDTFSRVKDDNGGIYTLGLPTAKYYGNRITNNIVLNGIGNSAGTDKPGTGSSNGIYMDDYANDVFINGNTMANCFNGGLMSHNAIAPTITNNLMFNNGVQMLLIHDTAKPGLLLRNFVIKNNNMVAKRYQTVLNVITTGNDLSLIGIMDSNYYSRPENYQLMIYNSSYANGVQSNKYIDLPAWKTSTGLDQNSKQGLPPMAVLDSIVGPNLITNGTFSANITGLYSSPVSKWALKLDGGALQGTTTAGYWQVIIKTLPIKAFKKYRLQFSSIASKDTLINAYVRLSTSPYTKFTDSKVIPLKSVRIENKYLLTSIAASSNSSLVFDTKAPALTFWLDNIGLYETKVTQPDPLTYYLFDYNAGNTIKTIPLIGNYFDAYGNSFSGSVNINPHSSIILTH